MDGGWGWGGARGMEGERRTSAAQMGYEAPEVVKRLLLRKANVTASTASSASAGAGAGPPDEASDTGGTGGHISHSAGGISGSGVYTGTGLTGGTGTGEGFDTFAPFFGRSGAGIDKRKGFDSLLSIVAGGGSGGTHFGVSSGYGGIPPVAVLNNVGATAATSSSMLGARSG